MTIFTSERRARSTERGSRWLSWKSRRCRTGSKIATAYVRSPNRQQWLELTSVHTERAGVGSGPIWNTGSPHSTAGAAQVSEELGRIEAVRKVRRGDPNLHSGNLIPGTSRTCWRPGE